VSDALAPYVVGRDGPFGRAEAAHLLRRAGFGARPEEQERAVAAGLAATVEKLLADDEGKEAAQLGASGALVAEGDALAPLQGVWLGRMVATRAPLREKLALLWHGHFATSLAKVQRATWMWWQYELFRARGAGRFGELALAVARDPAMLVWLDGSSNEKTAPNENFARELLELFTLGRGEYGERDVQEAARCFTGWHVKEQRFWFNERAHDAKPKRVLGRDGLQDGGEVVDVAVAHPACARFVATKLLKAFVADAPDEAAIAETAAAFAEEGLDVHATLRRLFLSRLFFDRRWRRARIAAPVEWCVSLLRRTATRSKLAAVGTATGEMGQALFAPPDVKGWDGGAAWVSSRTLLARGRFAAALAYGDGALGTAVDWAMLAGTAADRDGATLVARLAELLVDDGLEPATRARLVAFADSEGAGGGATRIARVAHLLLSAPEALLV